MSIDPLGLARCVKCNNAFSYDRDRVTTAALFGDPDGERFICKTCADPYRKP